MELLSQGIDGHVGFTYLLESLTTLMQGIFKLRGRFSRQHLGCHLIPRRRNESKMSNHILVPLFAAYVLQLVREDVA
jgi:hypothetical protein